jgi:hypothetical protein
MEQEKTTNVYDVKFKAQSFGYEIGNILHLQAICSMFYQTAINIFNLFSNISMSARFG